jgi:hypothetical protein
MPGIATLSSAKIYIYADDHNPPHFNLLGPDTNANIYIETGEVYEGKVTRRALEEAKAWWSIDANRQLLRDRWREYNERD